MVCWGKCIYCNRDSVWEVVCSLFILISLDLYPRPIWDCISACQCQAKAGRDKAGVRTRVSGRNPLRWLPTERPPKWGNTDYEDRANAAENARVKDYRILVGVSLLFEEYLSGFIVNFGSCLGLTRVRYEERKKDMLGVYSSIGDQKGYSLHPRPVLPRTLSKYHTSSN